MEAPRILHSWRIAADELSQEIEDEKLPFKAAYEEIKALAQDDPALLKSIMDRDDA